MSKNGTRVIVCERCRRLKLHHARSVCKSCYNKLAEGRDRSGLDHYPTLAEQGLVRVERAA
jgi:ribosomal protein L37E